MVCHVLLVRHASSVPPAVGAPSEHERPLSPDGRLQAECLAELLVPRKPKQVLASPYLRAVQTVLPTAASLGVPVTRSPELREWASGIGATSNWESHYRYCWAHPDWSLPAGEPHLALQKRAGTLLRRAMGELADGEVTVLASHGTWIARGLQGLGVSINVDFWLAMPIPAIYDVRVSEAATTVSGPGLRLAAVGR